MNPRACTLAALPLVALAAPALGAEPPRERTVSVTFSPIHLAIGPILEVTGELRLAPRIGVAGILGGGQFTEQEDTTGPKDTFDAFEIGASGRYYALGDFDRGLQVGVEVLYLRLSGEDVNGSGLSATGDGLAAGPFLGYKHVWSFGLTFDGQLGAAYLLVAAEGEDGSTAEEKKLLPILNLNLGWSF